MIKLHTTLTLLCCATLIGAQSLYDLNQIQEIRIYLSQPNWDYRMDTAKAGSESYLLADSVRVNGELFKKCGVKYKGNSSYDPNRSKNPLHIKLDFDKDADYQGYTDLKLGNGWSDNSMIREPLSYAILRNYMDAPMGNFARVFINDDYYGVMNNAESIQKRFLLERYYSSKYSFFKCNPISIGATLGGGSNLAYLGTNQANYDSRYELKSDQGWEELFGLCDTLNNHFAAFEQIADVDRFLWMLAFNNVLVNLDSYSGTFRQNYYLYRNHRQQWIPIVWDLNMSLGGFGVAGGIVGALTPATMPTMSHTLHKSESGWPLIFKLLNDPFYSKMYFAHMRTINNEQFADGQYKALALELHDLVDQAVLEDPNYLSNYDNFQQSLTSHTPGSNGAGTSPGIFLLMDARAAYLKNVLSAAPPIISGVSVLNGNNFGESATVIASITNATHAYLGYRYNKSERFVRVPMYDDGLHGDGAANDGVFGAECALLSPLVQYYLYAENSQTGAFSPERAEHEFYQIEVGMTPAAAGDVVINELIASNTAGIQNEQGKFRDWIELYNTTDQPLGLSHLYLATKASNLTKWPFPPDAFIAPHEHLLVWADNLNVSLVENHTNFALGKSGESLFLSDGDLVFDEITFGEQTDNQSLSRCPDGVGQFAQTIAPTPRSTNICLVASKEPSATAWIRVMPNPANEAFFVQGVFREAELLDTYGRTVATGATMNNGQTEIQTGTLPNGTYWLRCQTARGDMAVRKVVVLH